MLTERKKQPGTSKEAVEKKDEEDWPLSDVVFVEDVRSVPLGKVIKVRLCCRGNCSCHDLVRVVSS